MWSLLAALYMCCAAYCAIVLVRADSKPYRLAVWFAASVFGLVWPIVPIGELAYALKAEGRR